jgi:hypothetical protein
LLRCDSNVSGTWYCHWIVFPGIWPFTAPVSSAPANGANNSPAKKKAKQRAITAVDLAKEWTYNPSKPRPPSYGSAVNRVGENLAIATTHIQDPNIAGKEWFKRAAKFYAEKCGSELNVEKHVPWHSGKGKGRYVIAEPFLMTTPLGSIPAQPNELFFAYDDVTSTVTTTVRQQGQDVVVILVTAAVR